MLIENQAAMETGGVWSFGNAVGRRCGEGEEEAALPNAPFAVPGSPWPWLGRAAS